MNIIAILPNIPINIDIIISLIKVSLHTSFGTFALSITLILSSLYILETSLLNTFAIELAIFDASFGFLS